MEIRKSTKRNYALYLEDEVMARLDKIAVSQKKSRSGLAQHFLEKGIRQLEGGCK